MKEIETTDTNTHKRVDRPWGYYEILHIGQGYQIKRIVVYPGGVLSLQKHRYRAEHWIVVRGTAEVTIDTDVRSLCEGESVDISVETIHRLANKGTSRLEVIETQTGSYFGEDDIVRIDDIYNRS